LNMAKEDAIEEGGNRDLTLGTILAFVNRAQFVIDLGLEILWATVLIVNRRDALADPFSKTLAIHDLIAVVAQVPSAIALE